MIRFLSIRIEYNLDSEQFHSLMTKSSLMEGLFIAMDLACTKISKFVFIVFVVIVEIDLPAFSFVIHCDFTILLTCSHARDLFRERSEEEVQEVNNLFLPTAELWKSSIHNFVCIFMTAIWILAYSFDLITRAHSKEAYWAACGYMTSVARKYSIFRTNFAIAEKNVSWCCHVCVCIYVHLYLAVSIREEQNLQ